MAYVKPTQTPFAANLAPNETVVTLDSGEHIAVCSNATRIAGNMLTISASARQVDPGGSGMHDGNGHGVLASMSHQFTASDVSTYGAQALTKDCVLLVLGETPLIFGATPGLPPLSADVMGSYSIRHAIGAAAHAGSVRDLGALL